MYLTFNNPLAFGTYHMVKPKEENQGWGAQSLSLGKVGRNISKQTMLLVNKYVCHV